MSDRWKAGFIQYFFDPLDPAPLNSFGPLYAWGAGTDGALGDNTVVDKSSPIQIGSLANWSKLGSSRGNFLGAIKTDNTLWMWGQNGSGRLGIGNTVYQSSPVQVGALTNWNNVTSGLYHTIAVKNDGTLWSWGNNDTGQLGIDTVYGSKSSPVQIGALSTWLKISAGAYFNLAIKTDGTLWSWGLNSFGQLGLNDQINRSSPVQVGALTNWTNISNGGSFSTAIKNDGTIWAWGANSIGALGQNDAINRSSPVQIGALTNWSEISSIGNAAFAINSSNQLYSWGQNGSGQLGHNDTTSRSSPTQVGSLANWKTVSTGGSSKTYSIKTDNTLWAWGLNTNGQLGTGDAINRSSPVQIGSLALWIQAGSSEVSGFGILDQ